jgi:hypothetical protein
MPRRMPRFDKLLANHAQLAIAIVKAGEMAHVCGTAVIRKEWSTARLEALYELAFLRVFAAWEMCLEAVFYRSLCGFASTAGQETLISGRYYPTLAAAESAVLGGRSYVLWHNPQHVIDRCRRFFRSGAPGCPSVQETMVASKFTYLVNLASIRHRVVHDQADAKRKFDTATLQIAARTYPSSRPGKFLRDWDASTSPPQRWLEVTIAGLTALTGQIV